VRDRIGHTIQNHVIIKSLLKYSLVGVFGMDAATPWSHHASHLWMYLLASKMQPSGGEKKTPKNRVLRQKTPHP
jgi:hypothetical protein